jgi:WD40 repeat protein
MVIITTCDVYTAVVECHLRGKCTQFFGQETMRRSLLRAKSVESLMYDIGVPNPMQSINLQPDLIMAWTVRLLGPDQTRSRRGAVQHRMPTDNTVDVEGTSGGESGEQQWQHYVHAQLEYGARESPLQASDTLVRSIRAHGSTIRSCATSPDERLIATASKDKTVKLWHIDSDSCVRTFGDHNKPVNLVKFVHQGSYVASSSSTALHIWEPERGTSIRRFTGKSSLFGFTEDPVRRVFYSVSENTVRVYDLRRESSQSLEWRCIRDNNMLMMYGSMRGLAADPSGNYVAAVSTTGTVIIFDSRTGNILSQWRAMEADITDVGFVSERSMYTVGNDVVIFWSPSNLASTSQLRGT